MRNKTRRDDDDDDDDGGACCQETISSRSQSFPSQAFLRLLVVAWVSLVLRGDTRISARGGPQGNEHPKCQLINTTIIITSITTTT
jgi:hypothetical protein